MSDTAGATSHPDRDHGRLDRVRPAIPASSTSAATTERPTGGTATLNITGGGTVSGSGPNGLVLVDIGRNNATGTVNISGAGSQLLVAGVGGQNTQGLDGVGGLVIVGRTATAVSGTLNITNGGCSTISDNGLAASSGGMGLRIGDRPGRRLRHGDGIRRRALRSSSQSTSGDADDALRDRRQRRHRPDDDQRRRARSRCSATGQRNFTVGNAATGSGVLTMTTGATLVASRFAIGDNGGIGSATIDNSTVNLDGVVFNNGLDRGRSAPACASAAASAPTVC